MGCQRLNAKCSHFWTERSWIRFQVPLVTLGKAAKPKLPRDQQMNVKALLWVGMTVLST